MINTIEKIDFLESFKMNIDNILKNTPEELIREEDLGKVFSFKPIAEDLGRIFDIIRELKKSDLDKIPINRLESLNSEIRNFGKIILSIKNYIPNENNKNDRVVFMDRVENFYNLLFANVAPYINYLNNDFDSLKKFNKDVDDAIKNLYNVQSEIFEIKNKVVSETESILKNLREAAAESGVTKYSKIFATEANENKTKANHWLIATMLLGLISIGIAYFFLTIRPLSEEPSYYEIIHFALTKIIVFSILYYLLVLFVKNYNAQRHNYVVNKHRQNALTTFGTFVSSSKDIDTKNAVLLQTTHSIFSAQTCGYLKNDIESEPSQKLIEIIRASSNSINGK